MMPIEKHSIVIDGHKTSVSLEPPFWSSLKEIAVQKNTSVAMIIKELSCDRSHANLSSAIRLFVLDTAQNIARPSSLG